MPDAQPELSHSMPRYPLSRLLILAAALFLASRLTTSAALPPARDTSFQTLGMDGLPNASVVLPDGRILIGGTFQNIGGTPRPALARLNADGTVDTSFAPPIGGPGAFGKATVQDLARLPDGRFIAAGSPAFRTTGAVIRTNLIRFNADGTVDASFDVHELQFWRGLAPLADGRVVIAMTSATAPFKPVRLTANGSLDPTFNDPTGYIAGLLPMQLALQPDGHVLKLSGDADPNRTGNQELSRLNADGSRDATFKFTSPPNNVVDDSYFTVAADGRVLVTMYEGVGVASTVVTRLAPDGTRDTGFSWSGPANNQRLYPVACTFLPDGGAIAVRQPTAGDRRLTFYYLGADGKLTATRELLNSAYDNGVVGIGTQNARAFAMQPDGRLLFAAGFLDGSQNTFGMFRLPPPPVPAPPVITQQPAGATIGAGDFLGLSVTATSESPLSYRWFHSATNLVPAQTNAFLNLNGSSAERAGDFFVVVDNPFGSVTSQVATIIVRAPAAPVITQQPQGGTVRLSQPFTLQARCQTEVDTGFQWYKDGAPYAGANGGGQSFGFATLILPANDANRAGDYYVVITNAWGGTVTSATVHLDLIFPGPPQFTVQPQDLNLFPSQPVQLGALAIGDGNPIYQWRHEGTNLVPSADIPSVNGSSLYVFARNANRAGTYSVVATLNPGGSTTSRVATVTILPSGPPILLSQPTGATLALGDRTNLLVALNGDAPITVFWQHAGTNLPPQTLPQVDGPITNQLQVYGTPNGAGDYRFIATNRFGAVTSLVATVTVLPGPAPEFRKDLADVTANLGEYNTVRLANGLVVTNCCGNIETTHILALTPDSGIPPFPNQGTWFLAMGVSNRFYVGAASGFNTVTSTWSYVPGAIDFTGLQLTNFPAAGNVSRLETFDDGRYGIGLPGSLGNQSGHFRVLGSRRPATNVLSFDLVSSNAVSVEWYRDGAPLNLASRAPNFSILTESLGTPPVPGGVNTRYKLTLPDVTPADVGRYHAVVSTSVRNPDTSFGQPAFIAGGSWTSRVATLTVLGYAAGGAPEIVAAAAFGSPTALDETTAMAPLADDTVLLVTRTITFGGSSGTSAMLSIRNRAGEALRSASLAAETLNGGPLGNVKALVSDDDGGAYLAGDGASGTLEPWFLRRVRPATVISGGTTNLTFTNLWTSRTAGPFSNGLDNLTIPHGADVVGLVRQGDGVVVAGHFTGKPRFGSVSVVTNPALPFFTAQVGGITLTNSAYAATGRDDRIADLYVARFDALGKLLWVRQFGGTNAETLTTLTADPAGNLYLAGSFKTRTTFGGLAVEASKSSPQAGVTNYATDAFVARLGADGQPHWLRNFGGVNVFALTDTTVTSAVADAGGSVTFAATRVAGSAALQPGLVAGTRYLAHLNANGELLWTQEFNSQGNSQLAIDADGNVTLVDSIQQAGANAQPFTVGAGSLPPPLGASAVAAKFSPAGSLLWFRALDERVPFLEEGRPITPQRIATAPNGELVVAGRITGGTSGGVAKTTGQRFDLFELLSDTPGFQNSSDSLLLRLASAYLPGAPVLTKLPVTTTALLQDRVVLEGAADGYPPPKYQWLLDGRPVAGATNRTLIIPELARTNRGSYVLVASNALGVVSSSPAILTPELRPNMTGWSLVTSWTNYLGNPSRIAADDAGNFQLLHIETARGAFQYLDGFHADGTLAWRFAETIPGVFPVQNYIYTVNPRLAPLTLPSGEIFLAGRYQVNRLQGAGSTGNFIARLNPVDGTILWSVLNLGPVGSSIAAFDITDGVVRVALSDRTVHRYALDGQELPGTTLTNLPVTVGEANSRTAFDRNGGFYFYANRVEALSLGATNLPALANAGAQTWVLARYDAAGTFQWSRTFSGPTVGVVDPFRVLVDPAGDAIVAGSFGVGNQAGLKFTIGTNQLTGWGYAAKITSAGDVRWAKSWFLHVDDAVLGPAGSPVLTGWLRTSPNQTPAERSIAFGTNRVAAAYMYDTFVASVDNDGNERYIRHTGAPNFVTFDNAKDYSVAVNSAGSVWAAGFSQMPQKSAALDFGDVHYAWPTLSDFNIGNLFGDLPAYYVARLDVDAAPPADPEVTFTPPAPGSTTLRLSWPAGYRLQYRENLYTGDWQTLDVVPPYDANVRATLQGYFRIVRAP